MKKIMFNDRYGLTQAVLDGRKTQTRRMIPKDFFSLQWDIDNKNNTLVCENDMGDFIDIRQTRYNRYKVGEVVAVAQSYKDCGYRPDKIFYRSIPEIDGYRNETAASQAGWNNKLFVAANLMPHAIRITNVRVEKLQDISENDCLAEGIIKGRVGSEDTHFMDAYYVPNVPNVRLEPHCTPREAYATLIDKVSGKGTWNSNPYVFVYDFELVKKGVTDGN